MNWGTPEIAEEAQREILGEDHVYPMIAFGTAKKKSAFKLYARSQDMEFDLANDISKQIERYDEALKYADDDEKEDINIYDYVDEQYYSYIDASKKYWGIIMDKKKAPCAYLLYNGSIREEIGLIKCKSESTKKEYITAVIDGAVAENYKFLKNDILKIDCALLTDMVFKRIGMDTPTVEEMRAMTQDDDKTWDIYRKGLTIGVNQCEKSSTIQKVKRYKPHNISELSAFIAAIRPGFKSMYKRFENRENFTYNIPVLDDLIQTKEMPVSFMIYQEQVMQILNYAGFPIDQCYTIIKAIAKKHPEKVRPLKEQFLSGLTNKLMVDENMAKDEAEEISDKIWTIIDDNCSYSFNSSHAYCMGLDSLYQAWQKAHHPYEFYEVLLQVYSDKGKKDKVADLKQEMKRGFGINEGDFKFGLDNRKFIADPDNHAIYPSLLSIKGLSQTCANDLYKVATQGNYETFYDLWKVLKQKKSLNSGKINVLAEIGYFKDFGSIGKVKKFLDILSELYDRTQFNKSAVPIEFLPYIVAHSEETEKQYRKFDYDVALQEIWRDLPDEDISLSEKLKYELDHIGYIKTCIPEFSYEYAYVQEYECKFKNPKLTLYRLRDGFIETVKVKRPQYDKAPIHEGNIIKVLDSSSEGRWFKDNDGEWMQDNNNKEIILKKWSFVID